MIINLYGYYMDHIELLPEQLLGNDNRKRGNKGESCM